MKKKLCCIPDITKYMVVIDTDAYSLAICEYFDDGTCAYKDRPGIVVEAAMWSSSMADVLNEITENCSDHLRNLVADNKLGVADLTKLTWSPPYHPALLENIDFFLRMPKDILQGIKELIQKQSIKKQRSISLYLTNINIMPEALCFSPENTKPLLYLNAFGKFKYSVGGITTSIADEEKISIELPKELQKVRTGFFEDTLNKLRLEGTPLL